MSAEIVELPNRKADRLIWVCNCNCSTFRLFADGHAECAACETIANGAPDGWRERLPPAPRCAEAVEPESVAVMNLDGADTFLKRRSRDAGDIAAVVVLMDDALISTWQRGDADLDWIKAQLDHAKDRLVWMDKETS